MTQIEQNPRQPPLTFEDFEEGDDDAGAKTIAAGEIPPEIIAQLRNRGRSTPGVPAAAPGVRPVNVVVSTQPELRTVSGDTDTQTTGPGVPPPAPEEPFNPFADLIDSAESAEPTNARPFDTHADAEDDAGDELGAEPNTNTTGMRARPGSGGKGKLYAVVGVLVLGAVGGGMYGFKVGPFAAKVHVLAPGELSRPIPDFGAKKPAPKPIEPIAVLPMPVEPRPEPKAEVKPEPRVEAPPEPRAVAVVEPKEKEGPPRDTKKREPKREPKPKPNPKPEPMEAKEPKEPKEPAAAPRVGSLSLVVEPPVHAFFAGKDLGVTPLKANLPVGRQSLRLVPSSGPPKTVSVDVKESGGAARFDLEDL